jgi:sulfate adenylyltransferase
VGRDQAGIGGFYEPYASQLIFDDLPVGVVPLRYPESFFCHRCDGISTPKTCPHPTSERESTSQTRIRTAIREGRPLPREILRPEIAELLLAEGNNALNLPPPPVLSRSAPSVPTKSSAVELPLASHPP